MGRRPEAPTPHRPAGEVKKVFTKQLDPTKGGRQCPVLKLIRVSRTPGTAALARVPG